MARTVGSMTSNNDTSTTLKGEVTHSMITPTTYPTKTSTTSTNTKRVRMSRYSWDAPEKTYNLLTLLITTLENKEDGERRYVSGQDWDLILIAYNEAMEDAPVSNVFALKNRLALLKLQFKDYQKVMEAKKHAPNEELDPKEWQALIAKYPETAKWRFTTLEYYDKLLRYFKLAGMEDGEIPSAPVGRPRLDKFKTVSREKKKAEKVLATASATIVTPNCSPCVTIRPNPTETEDKGVKEGEKPVDTLVAAVAEVEQQGQNQVRKRRAEEIHASTSIKHARLEKIRAVTTLEKTTAPSPNKKTQYEKALEVLTKLDLSIRERVDAKLFLTVDRFQLAFIHMEEEEQEEFLKRYCFQARDQYGRWKE